MCLFSFGEKGQIRSFTVMEDKQELLASFKLSKKKLKMWSEVKKKGVPCSSEVLGQATSNKYSKQTLLRTPQS